MIGAPTVYVLGIIVTLACAVLLHRAYRRVGLRLLLWSAVCFYGLAISNALVFIDIVMLPNVNLYRWRLISACAAMLILLYGLIWEGEG
jgi:hypothetical protein